MVNIISLHFRNISFKENVGCITFSDKFKRYKTIIRRDNKNNSDINGGYIQLTRANIRDNKNVSDDNIELYIDEADNKQIVIIFIGLN